MFDARLQETSAWSKKLVKEEKGDEKEEKPLAAEFWFESLKLNSLKPMSLTRSELAFHLVIYSLLGSL